MKNYGEKKFRKNYQKKSINVEKTQKKSEEICWTKINKISLKNKKIRKIEMGKKSKKKKSEKT